VTLDEFGDRICIMGPSNSGKSTLAAAIGAARCVPVVHLDQYRHRPATQWEVRPDDEFRELHDAAIAGDRWVIDGNYSALLPQRLGRASGLILLDANLVASLTRYVRRSSGATKRVGGLDGVTDRVSWEMIRFILGPGQANRRRYRETFDQSQIPKVFLANRRALERFYVAQKIIR